MKIFQFSESVQYILQLSACMRSLILIDRRKTFQEADMFKVLILHGDPGLNSLEIFMKSFFPTQHYISSVVLRFYGNDSVL